jgi:Uma2 family endonuclease
MLASSPECQAVTGAPSLPTAPPPPANRPQPYRWTVTAYHAVRERLTKLGKRTRLIDGVILEMPMSDPIHDAGVLLAQYLFMSLFQTGHVVRVQLPLPLNINTDPEPDLAVLVGDVRTHTRSPQNAVLVLEVANSSLDDDLGYTAELYAAAGVPDYWVTDVQGGQLFVHRQPVADATAKYGHRYAAVTVLTRGQSLAPLALPGRPVAADELLP